MPSNDDKAKVEARIREFLKDHYELNSRYSNSLGSGLSMAERIERLEEFHDDHETRNADAQVVAQKHWIHPDRMEFTVCTPPKHSPYLETIHDIAISGDSALVATIYADGGRRHPMLYEYYLERSEDTWKIARFVSLESDTSIPADSTIALLEVAFSNQFDPRKIGNLDLTHAFEKGAVLHGMMGYERIGVQEVGNITFPSGRVIVHDPGSLGYCVPLALRVPVGPHPVTISFTEHHVGAVRVHWGDLSKVIGYVPAQTVSHDRPYIVSSDVANVAIADAELISRMNHSQRDRQWNHVLYSIQEARWAAEVDSRRASMDQDVHFVGESFVSVTSGSGDGGYPCSLGIDGEGKPICLVVEFCVYGENETFTSTVPLSRTMQDGFLQDEFLDKYKMSVHTEKRDTQLVLEVIQKHSLSVQLLDVAGNALGLVISSHEARSSPDGMVSVFYVDLPNDFTEGALRFILTYWRSDLEVGPDGRARPVNLKQLPFYNRQNRPTRTDIVRMLKQIPHLIELAQIVEGQEEVQPLRIGNRLQSAQEHAEQIRRGLNNQSVNGLVGFEEMMRVLKEHPDTGLDVGILDLQSKQVCVFFEYHTGKVLTGFAYDRLRGI